MTYGQMGEEGLGLSGRKKLGLLPEGEKNELGELRRKTIQLGGLWREVGLRFWEKRNAGRVGSAAIGSEIGRRLGQARAADLHQARQRLAGEGFLLGREAKRHQAEEKAPEAHAAFAYARLHAPVFRAFFHIC